MLTVITGPPGPSDHWFMGNILFYIQSSLFTSHFKVVDSIAPSLYSRRNRPLLTKPLPCLLPTSWAPLSLCHLNSCCSAPCLLFLANPAPPPAHLTLLMRHSACALTAKMKQIEIPPKNLGSLRATPKRNLQIVKHGGGRVLIFTLRGPKMTVKPSSKNYILSSGQVMKKLISCFNFIQILWKISHFER